MDFKWKVNELWGEIYQIKKGNGLIKQKYKYHLANPKIAHFPSLFPKIQNQIFNNEIKDVLKKIGITNNVKVYEKRFGKIEQKLVPKYTLVSSVTGRRTFISHSLRDGIPYEVLMKSTGHKDIKSLMRYTRVDQEIVNKEFLTKKRKLIPSDDWLNNIKDIEFAKKFGIDPDLYT